MPRPGAGPRLVLVRRRTGAVWHVTWHERGHTRIVSTGCREREEAERFLGEWLLRRGRVGPATAGPRRPDELLIFEALDMYVGEHAPRTAAAARTGYAVQRLLQWWGESRVEAVTPASCAAYVADRGAKPGTAARELVVLRAALNRAVKNGRLTAAPFVQMPPRQPGRDRWLTRSEAARLLNASRRTRHLALFVLIALYTGARRGAVLGLRWDRVDLERGRVDFNEPGRPRTIKRRPVLPIPRQLLAFLRAARSHATSPWVVAFRGERVVDVKKSFREARLRAGLGRDVTPHTLRHTAGTWMAQAGVDLHQVAGWLGHTSARTTELYAHHHPDHLKGARAAMERRNR